MPPSSPSGRPDAAVRAQYNRWAAVYDWFWHRYTSQTLPVIQRGASVAPGERVLDLACGTGELLCRIARKTPAARLTGVDFAPAMVDRSRRKLEDLSNTNIRTADAHDLPFEAGTFDVLLCANTFHYFSDSATVLAEARRVLRPGGRLVLLDWCRDFWTCRIMDIVLQWVDPAYATCYTLGELTRLLRASSFEPRTKMRYRFDLIWGMMLVEAHPVSAT
jgi:ubiquinone/menaquinone biosynthesis C-methylase UbiE